jgi:cytochrome c2
VHGKFHRFGIAATTALGDWARKWMRAGTRLVQVSRLAAWAQRQPRLASTLGILIFLFYSTLLLGGGLAAGFWAEREDIPYRIRNRLERLLVTARLHNEDTPQLVDWRRLETHLHSLDVARVRVGAGLAYGGAIVEVDGHIVFASPLGRLGYLSSANRIRPLLTRPPMGLEALRRSPLVNDPLFKFGEFRLYDLFALQTGSGRFDLYASHSRFVRENCFQFVVSKTQLSLQGDVVRLAGPGWRDVYVARPGCIPYKDRGWRFTGSEAGGRIVQLNATTLLISVGDHQFDGFDDTRRVAMDPNTDLGKIIALDLPSGRSRIYAMGVRNPQGLFVTRSGEVWETEHGPLAGDEVNLIREGGNYGWPLVTYGLNYGFPRRPWPLNSQPGRHDGYVRPALSFAPSIAISNLVSPSPEEFPYWEGDLLVGTLRAGALYHMRPEGDRIAYAEPIRFGRERLRDIISLRDGRIAILTDAGWIFFLRNAERHARAPRSFTVSGLGSLGGPDPEESPPTSNDGAARGRQVFASLCSNCHSLSGEAGVGPPLNGVMGRRVGSSADFRYSRALSAYDGVWTEDLLVSFLTEPDRRFRGTSMPETYIPWMEAPNVVAYLKTTRGGAAPRARR